MEGGVVEWRREEKKKEAFRESAKNVRGEAKRAKG